MKVATCHVAWKARNGLWCSGIMPAWEQALPDVGDHGGHRGIARRLRIDTGSAGAHDSFVSRWPFFGTDFANKSLIRMPAIELSITTTMG